MDIQTVLGLLALAAAAGFGTGKINLQGILSFLQKKTTPEVTPIVTATKLSMTPTKEEACQAALVLITYSIANGGDSLSDITDIAQTIYAQGK